MKNAVWRGRLIMFGMACCTILSMGGCTGLSDRELATIWQSVLTTALSTVVQNVVTGVTGT